MFEKPILIYSDYCVYSKNFLQTLIKYTDLYNSFIRMNIDVDISTRQRPKQFHQLQEILDVKITKVPTVITPNAQYILSDVDAFKWLEYQIKLLKDDSGTLQPFNPNEMVSFSDNYANYGSTDLCDAKEQNFKFYRDGKLTDDNYLNTSKSWDPNNKGKTNGFLNDLESKMPSIDLDKKQNERQYFSNVRQAQNTQNMGNQYIQNIQNNQNSAYYDSQRNKDITINSNSNMINFVDPNFGLSGQLGNKGGSKGGVSQKNKEIDMKLQQLMQDRENVDMLINQQQRQFY